MSAQDDLATLKANNAADAAVLNTLETELDSSPAPSAADNVLAALVAALEAAGYTVTPPEAPEVPGEAQDAEDLSEQPA